MASKDVALRKRQQIDSSKRTMFIVIASVAFLAGIALVVSFFLVKQIIFHTAIISAKQNTLNSIKANTSTVDRLKDNIRVLDTNADLNSVKTSDQSSALQVILDALPAEANSDALGASLQEKFINAVPGLRLDSMVVTSTGSSDDGSVSGDGDTPSIEFHLSVTSSADKLKDFLVKLEHSIRVIEISSIDIQAGSEGLTMNLAGKAYYEPARKIELGEKVIKP